MKHSLATGCAGLAEKELPHEAMAAARWSLK
ncbi:MAG: hypothetical protein K0S72_2240, partial [Arthrobacter sp.]|nr:hypothetical protein [Arthrobacter sp.]